MIKRLKKPCYVAICDYCGEDLFGNEYVAHFETKQELLDEIECDYIETQDKKHYCSSDCWNKATGVSNDKK